MKIFETSIKDVKVVAPEVLRDERGEFFESHRDSWLDNQHFVQENQSRSKKGTIRGLHYQLKNPQGKLVRVLAGEVFDVAVDLRKSSATFGRWVGRVLNERNKETLWVPPGFAHGFLVISKSADLLYKCTDYYDPEDERILLWNDPQIMIDWPLQSNLPLLSKKDKNGNAFDRASTYD